MVARSFYLKCFLLAESRRVGGMAQNSPLSMRSFVTCRTQKLVRLHAESARVCVHKSSVRPQNL